MVSQLLFGETYQVVTEDDEWMEIITAYDQYSGWIDRKFFSEVSGSYYSQFQMQEHAVQSSLLMNIERQGSPPLLILPGSTLPGFNKKRDSLEIENKIYNIRWTFGAFELKGLNSINKTAGYFLNAPYLWGGRSLFGCDCSGFVQVIYKIHGIRLKRDADQQAEQGDAIASLSKARLGDLAFFADETGRVSHVGLVISPGEIVHGSGYVHQDRLDEKGIFNPATQQYTHKLFQIRRYW
jgi:hypothetical protein